MLVVAVKCLTIVRFKKKVFFCTGSMFEVPFLQSSLFFFDYHLSCFHRRSVELQRAGSGLLDKVITDTRSLKQIPLTEFSSDKDSGEWSFLRQHWGYLCLILRELYARWPVLHDRIAGSGVDPSRLLVFWSHPLTRYVFNRSLAQLQVDSLQLLHVYCLK